MKTQQDKKQTVDTLIAKLDERLIKNGYKPTEPTHKTGTFVHISNKPKRK